MVSEKYIVPVINSSKMYWKITMLYYDILGILVGTHKQILKC